MLNLVQAVAVTSSLACRVLLMHPVVVVCDGLMELLLTLVGRCGQHPTTSQFRHNLVDLRLAK